MFKCKLNSSDVSPAQIVGGKDEKGVAHTHNCLCDNMKDSSPVENTELVLCFEISQRNVC